MEVIDNPAHFGEPVTAAMESHLVTVPPSASLAQLMEIFKHGLVAIVVDGNEFLGLITRIDLPQAVDAAGNNHAQRMLMRDVGNLAAFFGRFIPASAGAAS